MLLMGLLVDWTWLRKESELEDISIDSLKTEKHRKQRLKINRTGHSGTVEKLQKI